jgi:hypothetical protein
MAIFLYGEAVKIVILGALNSKTHLHSHTTQKASQKYCSTRDIVSEDHHELVKTLLKNLCQLFHPCSSQTFPPRGFPIILSRKAILDSVMSVTRKDCDWWNPTMAK